MTAPSCWPVSRLLLYSPWEPKSISPDLSFHLAIPPCNQVAISSAAYSSCVLSKADISAMAEFKQVVIQIRREQKSITELALSSPKMSCNIIERACVEKSKQPWTPSDSGINYDFSDHASPPLGRCELDWGWEEGSATVTDTFIVVEEIKGTSCRVILGPTVAKLPLAPPWNTYVLTIAMSRRSRGTDNSLI